MISGLLQLSGLSTFVSLFIYVFAAVLVPDTVVERYSQIVLLWSLRAFVVLFVLNWLMPRRRPKRRRKRLPCRF